MHKLFIFLSLLLLSLLCEAQDEDIKLTFPGQYRINFYSADNDIATQDRQTASRLRIRQNINLEFDDTLSSVLQIQLNHTNENVSVVKDVNNNDLTLRHAYISYKTSKYSEVLAGIIPVKEFFNDILYSSDWDYNPLALEGIYKHSNYKLHYFFSQLQENSETNKNDDILHFQADLIYEESKDISLTFSSSYLSVYGLGTHYNLGMNAVVKLSQSSNVRAALLYSSTDKDVLSTTQDASGYAVIVEYKQRLSNVEYALMFTHASGKDDASGFLVPLAFSQANSYWGYTGIMTTQGPTDTGFDSDALNISNNGYGMSTMMIKSTYKFNKKSNLYVALAYFGNSKANNRDSFLGYDAIVMSTYKLHKYLNLDLGFDYARLNDGISSYNQGVVLGTSFNQNKGVTRYKKALFGRLQLEF